MLGGWEVGLAHSPGPGALCALSRGEASPGGPGARGQRLCLPRTAGESGDGWVLGTLRRGAVASCELGQVRVGRLENGPPWGPGLQE